MVILASLFAPELRAWYGKAPLTSVFWLYGVLVSSLLIVLYARAVRQGHLFTEQILLILFGLYTVWILVSIWRCSFARETFWGLLARLLTVTWAANAALVLLFLQLELLIRIAGIAS